MQVNFVLWHERGLFLIFYLIISRKLNKIEELLDVTVIDCRLYKYIYIRNEHI